MKVPKVAYLIALVGVGYIIFLDITSGVSIFGMIIPIAVGLMLMDYV